ncbi:hypothetical protein MNBD_ALPHA01-1643 [hydrothermal vent metagenome]|uniref:Capsule synthesis protein CapA domain-containing protein n=1 Tax=hydrothermal vent metagenome TaxID=652676 RepID=A0A3B0SJV7_9ZZZZ
MDKKLTIGFVGDFCLSQAHKKSTNYLSDAFDLSRKLNNSVDLAIANLEFCITPPDVKDVPGMALPAIYAENLSSAGFDIFCLSNNHIGDYGEDTLLHSKSFLEERGHLTVGAGKNILDATQPLYIEKNGFRVAIINVCDETRYFASEKTAGISPLAKPIIKKMLCVAKKEADVVIICIHADLEFSNSPAPWRVALSRELAELGPDMIIHHHPHTLQGIEYWNDVIIAYSLGNYIFPIYDGDYMQNREGFVDEGIYLTVTLVDKQDGTREISHKITPTQINKENVTSLATGDKKNNIIIKMQDYSTILENPSELRRAYFRLCKIQMKTTLMGIYYRIARKEYIVAWQYLKHHFSTNFHTRWIKGFFTLGQF